MHSTKPASDSCNTKCRWVCCIFLCLLGERMAMVMPSTLAPARATQLKRGLTQLLVEERMSIESKQARDLVRELSELNALANPVTHPLWRGSWRLISKPDFPGTRTRDDGEVEMTLGVATFGMLQPHNLILRVTGIQNDVHFVSSDSNQITCDVSINFEATLSPSSFFSGVLRNKAFAVPSQENPCRVDVEFYAGQLSPLANISSEQWQELVGDAQTRRILPTLMKLTVGSLFKIERSDEKVDGILRPQYVLHRPSRGWVDALYVDEQLRITKGHEGSIVVAERI